MMNSIILLQNFSPWISCTMILIFVCVLTVLVADIFVNCMLSSQILLKIRFIRKIFWRKTLSPTKSILAKSMIGLKALIWRLIVLIWKIFLENKVKFKDQDPKTYLKLEDPAINLQVIAVDFQVTDVAISMWNPQTSILVAISH